MFCTALEAFGYAKSYNYIENWKKVLPRLDLPIDLAIKGAIFSKKTEAWIIVLARPDLDPTIALQYAVKMEDDEIWKTVLRRLDIDSIEVAYARAKVLKSVEVWTSVLCREDGVPATVIETATELDNPDVWREVLKLPRIVEYLKQLSSEDLLTLAKSAKNYGLSMMLVKRDFQEPKDALVYAKTIGYSDVWNVVLTKEKVKSYTASLNSDELISLAVEMDTTKFWERILLMPIIAPDAAFFYLSKTVDDFVWQKVLRRKDVIEWLDRLLPAVLVEIGKKINNWHIWKILIERSSLIEYLNKLNPKDAIELAVYCDDIHLSDFIIGRPDFAFIDAFEIAKQSKNGCAWSAATKKPDFTTYINALSDDEAIAFSRLHNDAHIWRIVLARRTITPYNVILNAKIANDEKTWDIVRLRSDVISYLEPSK